MNQPSPGSCPNCGATDIGNYCPQCGQRVADVRVTVGRLLRDVLEDQFSLNSAFLRTMRALFFKPGFLTREYLDLRISRYIPPFRLYLIASLLFFVVVSFKTSRARIDVGEELRSARDSLAAETARDATAPRDTAATRDSATAEPEPRGPGMRVQTRRGTKFGVTISDSTGNWAENSTVNTGNARLDAAIKRRLLALGELPPGDALRRLMMETLEHAPKIMFLLLPVYAFLLKILYIRRKRYYVEHFVFALHVHSFMFLLFFLYMLLSKVPVVQGLLLLWMWLYTLIAMKRVYGQGWIKTTVKWMTLGFSYMILLSLGFVAAIVGAFFTA